MVDLVPVTTLRRNPEDSMPVPRVPVDRGATHAQVAASGLMAALRGLDPPCI